MLRRTFCLAAGLTAFGWMNVASAADVRKFKPKKMKRKLSDKEWVQVVESAGKMRKWRVVERHPGIMILRYEKPQFWADVQVSFGGDTFQVAYHNSQNLDYEPPKGDRPAKIHRNVNRWAANLELDISRQIDLLH